MAHIDYYFATISPFTYFAGTQLEQAAAKHGAAIVYKPLDIMALFSQTGGTPPKDRHPNRQAYRLQDMERRAKRLGLPLNMKPAHWPTNMAPSSYAIIAAQNAGGGDLAALAASFSRLCWAEDKDISQDDVIRSALEAAGFDPALADKGLLNSAETYAANLDQAVRAGVFGAPFYITDDGQRFWGQDRLEDLELHLAGKL
ncbi:MAG: 2-hydroxychromene-2-carboxylate isomerase [Paracoccaceae bacterium]|jgi:2-hydroxychromene-2-carboxylate isomerase